MGDVSSARSLSPSDPLYEEAPTVDLSQLSPEELKLYKLYGRLPKKSDILNQRLKERKYFDSGDYAMSKAGIKPQEQVGISRNPLNNPKIETISRINRNSISGSVVAAHQINGGKSQLENEATETAIDDDDEEEA
ncbi:unnamed protein product [Kuraishia capsulata CBS 1993]|uniref:mRNA stability protein n=1 Tax=Kuraishia capsulata CBS 1993 TaxID=1382522 RepID=W6MMN1_9ASCO|nr:uncharacterized protein KUCA_T00003800001 [Kuraishia capsulata CBS 1993]CDK27821.1 unnamed protein product [Kuraishia capsulata CBS 1993]